MFAVVYLPDFALQAALRLNPEIHGSPVALLDEFTKARICQLTPAAREAGVVEGLTSTQALARCATVIIKPRSRAQETATTEALLQCASLFSPTIEATGEGICTLDLTGLNQAADEGWAQKIIEVLKPLQLTARVGVAATPSLAFLAARRAKPFLAVPDSTEFVTALPMEDLEPSAEMLTILKKWGIHRVGDFLRLGREQVVERLGMEALELFHRASANEGRPLNPVRPSEIFAEGMEFEHEVESLEPLIFVLNRLLDQLEHRLELVSLVAQELHLQLRLSTGQVYERTFVVPAPTRQTQTLFRILQTHLESLKTEAPIVAIHLCARPAFQEQHQFGLFEASLRDPNRFYETIARLTSLLGAGRVGSPVPLPTHRPDAFVLRRADFRQPEWMESPEPSVGLPLRRLRPPVRALVELAGGRPVSVRSSLFNARVQRATGPWRASGDWWDNQRWAQDEWEIQTHAGELYRLAERDGKWFVEGVFD